MLAPSTDRTEAWPPDYVETYIWRQRQLQAMRTDPVMLAGAKEYYRDHPADFIDHWCDTFDPRNAGSGKLARMPFKLFQRQRDLVEFLEACRKGEANGAISKCRDMGATWVACSYSVWLWLFINDSAVGWGSRKEDLVDKLGDTSSIFEKIRRLTLGLPRVFWPAGLSQKDHMTYMRMINPENGNTIIGETGDNIGRGGRTSIYFKDESAHYPRPELIEAALGDNTRVQIDISSVNGPGTVFDRKCENGIDWEPGREVSRTRANVFAMDWWHHPEKTQAWYDERREAAKNNGLLHVHAQEVDRNPMSAVLGTIIPAEWVAAALDADEALGFTDDGMWLASLDVADGGIDTNAFLKRKGVVLKDIQEWGEVDTGKTTRRAVAGCEGLGSMQCQYDCIGVGAGVKAEANRLAEDDATKDRMKPIRFVPWNAGAAVYKPDENVIKGDKNTPLNKDFFSNFKAQAWWSLRRRCEKTYRARHEGIVYPSDELISIPSKHPLARKLCKELSQPTKKYDSKMRLVVDKTPDGMRSPNLADGCVILYFPAKGGPLPLDLWV